MLTLELANSLLSYWLSLDHARFTYVGRPQKNGEEHPCVNASWLFLFHVDPTSFLFPFAWGRVAGTARVLERGRSASFQRLFFCTSKFHFPGSKTQLACSSYSSGYLPFSHLYGFSLLPFDCFVLILDQYCCMTLYQTSRWHVIQFLACTQPGLLFCIIPHLN